MSDPVWPLDLPQRPIRDGWSETKPDLAIRTQMESGAIKTRRKATSAPGAIQITFRMTTAQLATFDEFHDTTLADGTLPYQWVHPISGATVRLLFKEPPTVEPPGQNRVTHNVRIHVAVLP